MPRNDDFGDLPSLMPDSDEIKATSERMKKPSSHNHGRSAATANPRQPTRSVVPQASQANRPQVVGKNSGMLWGIVWLMLLSVIGGGYWTYYKLIDVDLLLTVSRGELGHARKRIGELEALVVATDVNSNKSGTVVQTQVKQIDDRAKVRNKLLDTEIDKLWGVAYRTNRPAIEENQKAIDNNTATVKQHNQQIESQAQLFKQQQGAMQGQQAQVDQVNNASQLAIKQVEDQLHKLALLQDKMAQLLSTVSVHEKTLSDQNKTSLGHAQLAQQQAQDIASIESKIRQQDQVLLGVAGNTEQTGTLASRGNQLESTARLVSALEQNASEMDERLFLLEQSLDSVNSFRRDTNRSLDQVRSQIRNLAYGE